MLRLEELEEFREVRNFGLRNIGGQFSMMDILLSEEEMLEVMIQ